jgi:hypothetical protein
LDPFEVLKLLRDHGYAVECNHIHSDYQGIFRRRDGSEFEGTLTLRQWALRDGEGPLFMAEFVYDEDDEAAAIGNMESSIRDAINGIHWDDL